MKHMPGVTPFTACASRGSASCRHAPTPHRTPSLGRSAAPPHSISRDAGALAPQACANARSVGQPVGSTSPPIAPSRRAARTAAHACSSVCRPGKATRSLQVKSEVEGARLKTMARNRRGEAAAVEVMGGRVLLSDYPRSATAATSDRRYPASARFQPARRCCSSSMLSVMITLAGEAMAVSMLRVPLTV